MLLRFETVNGRPQRALPVGLIIPRNVLCQAVLLVHEQAYQRGLLAIYVAEFQARETMAMRKRVVPRGLHVLCDLTNSE